MANYKVGDVVKFTLTWRDNIFDGVFKNVLHFRGVEATNTSAQMQTFITGVMNEYLDRILLLMREDTYLSHILVENLTDLTEPTVEHLFGVGDVPGTVTSAVKDVPQAAACITRKSFLRGRKAVGHIYFGPLPGIFADQGLLTVDPTGPGDLNDVLDAFGDPLIDGATGWQARPIVCNAAGTGVVPNNDVRTQSFATKVVYLRSRRPGVGE